MMKENRYKQVIELLSYKPIGHVLLRLCGVGFSVWDYGTCHYREARKHKLKGNVQFVLWKKGEHGHKNNFWHNFDHSWWVQFVKH